MTALLLVAALAAPYEAVEPVRFAHPEALMTLGMGVSIPVYPAFQFGLGLGGRLRLDSVILSAYGFGQAYAAISSVTGPIERSGDLGAGGLVSLEIESGWQIDGAVFWDPSARRGWSTSVLWRGVGVRVIRQRVDLIDSDWAAVLAFNLPLSTIADWMRRRRYRPVFR